MAALCQVDSKPGITVEKDEGALYDPDILKRKRELFDY